jgi:hypothetical protein
MMQRSRPDSYQPPYPAFQSHFAADEPEVSMASIGVQSVSEGPDAAALLDGWLALLERTAEGAPRHVERARHVDRHGHVNELLLAYWRQPADQRAFWTRADVETMAARRLTGPVGWWRESLSAPTSAVDGNYALPDVNYGTARYAEQKLEQFHAYYGSMRDRTPDYLAGRADGAGGALAETMPESRGRRLRIKALPDKLCWIRSGFGWDQARPDEQAAFIDQMLPVYRAGADYLAAHPLESNCVAMRLLDEVPHGPDNGVQVETIGWFLTLKDLERWTHSHPTHAAIYKGVFDYMRRFNFDVRLNLGHEVVVVPADGVEAEYSNCHPLTGFLPFFPSREIGG